MLRVFEPNIACVLMGVSMIALSIVMLITFPQTADLAPGFNSPIIAFEFARSIGDISFLIGLDSVSVFNREAMRAGHVWDMLFPITYSGFLLMLFIQLSSQRKRQMLTAGFCLLIVIFDIHENLILLNILDAAELGTVSAYQFSGLYIATWLKWAMIAVVVLQLALQFFNQRKWVLMISASVYVLSCVVAWMLNSPAMLVEFMALVLSIFFMLAFIDQVKRLISQAKSFNT